MRIEKETKRKRAQTAIEYMLLLALVVTVVLASFKTLIPRTNRASEMYFNKVANEIMGEAPDPDWLQNAGRLAP